MRCFYTRRSSPYTSAVANDAIGRISTAATEHPIHSPQVSEPVTANPPNAPASMTASSNTTAKAAVKNTSSKRPRTSSLLRPKAANGPRCSLTITGANKDQRVSSHRPGITSRLAVAVGSAMAASEATVTSGTTGPRGAGAEAHWAADPSGSREETVVRRCLDNVIHHAVLSVRLSTTPMMRSRGDLSRPLRTDSAPTRYPWGSLHDPKRRRVRRSREGTGREEGRRPSLPGSRPYPYYLG